MKLYSTHRDKNFEILGISVDDDRKEFDRAVAEWKLPWRQVFDARAMEGEVPALFNVRYTPTLFLLDRSGIIVARDLHGAELEAAIEKALHK